MKKNYFFGALMSLMLVLFALPVKAQVESLADLFGKYQFTADMEVMAGMDKYAEQLSADCEAEISKGAVYDAQIVGFAGATSQMNINAISTEKKMIKATNPNTPQLWDALYLANENGDYPFGVFDNEKGEWTVESYGPVYMSYDPATKLITIPDFTVVTCDFDNSKATVVAKFTNVKMTFKASAEIEVADLSGSWHATPLGTYGSNSESSIPAEYDFVLTKTGEDNENYSAELTIGDFAPVTLSATFDGVSLAIHAKDVVLDATTGAVIYWNGATEYDITFSYASETTLSMSTPLCIGLPNPEAGEDEPKYTMEQWYMNGSAKRAAEGGASFDWAGTWTVKGTEAMANVPVEFDMVVTYNESADIYLITNFLGNDVTSLNYGGILLTPSADGKTAEIKTGTYLQMIEPGVAYLTLFDSNVKADPIIVTVNEDGTISIADFSVVEGGYGAAPNVAGMKAFYTGMTASKPVEEEVEPFDWAGTWTVKATENVAMASAEFEMVVTYNESADIYLITNFLGNDVTSLNYGGILLTPSADGKTAEIKTGTYLKTITPGVEYSVLYDSNMTANPINVTVNADGTLSISDFSVATNGYGSPATDAKISAYYVSVTASKPSEGGEEPFDWIGTWTVKATENVAMASAEFEMVVTYNEAAGIYLITNFLGNDVTSLNYGGILLTPSADNKTAEIKTGTYLKTITPGVEYSVLYDSSVSANPIKVTVNADGTLSISDFSVATNGYGSPVADAKISAYYVNVTASKGASSIESVKTAGAAVTVAGGVINIAGEAQPVQVYDAAGRLEFSGVASSVANLSKGIHIVKVGGAAVKVAVK